MSSIFAASEKWCEEGSDDAFQYSGGCFMATDLFFRVDISLSLHSFSSLSPFL